MSDYIEVHWVCGCLDEARKVSRYLVQERLVACAQIIPWIESCYMWNNQLETAQETKVQLKTHRSLFHKVMKVILENCTYQVPEVLAFPIQEGNPAYMEWMQETIKDYSNIPNP